MTNKEVSMRLKTAGFKAESESVGSLQSSGAVPHGQWIEEYPAYDAEVLYEWLRGWHRDDPFRSFSIENDGIAVFDWGPRDSDKWIEYEDSLATTMAKTILWILEDNDAQTKD